LGKIFAFRWPAGAMDTGPAIPTSLSLNDSTFVL
jgi:hypothetical protein